MRSRENTAEPTNHERALRGQHAIKQYCRATSDERCAALRDLLADLMHYADHFKSEFSTYDTGFDSALRAARGHYRYERFTERQRADREKEAANG